MAGVSLIREQIADLAEPILDGLGFELVDVEYLSKHGRWVLRIYIDKSGGVTIDDCARISGELGDLIDIKDIIEHEYVLEISSPGLNRPLRKDSDFARVVGKKIKVKMSVPQKGRRNFTGYLKEFQNRSLSLEVEGRLVNLPRSEIEKANVVYEFKN